MRCKKKCLSKLLKRNLKIGDNKATINYAVQKVKDEIDNVLLKHKCFNKNLLNSR